MRTGVDDRELSARIFVDGDLAQDEEAAAVVQHLRKISQLRRQSGQRECFPGNKSERLVQTWIVAEHGIQVRVQRHVLSK